MQATWPVELACDPYEIKIAESKKAKANPKMRQNGETKKAKDPTVTRPRSARSCSIEPRETRRSLRLQSIDKTISIASAIESDCSTNNSCANSCANSVYSSPRPANEPRKSKQRRNTHRNLCDITEDDINLGDAFSADTTQRHRQNVDEEEEEEEEEVEKDKAMPRTGYDAEDDNGSAPPNNREVTIVNSSSSGSGSSSSSSTNSTSDNNSSPARDDHQLQLMTTDYDDNDVVSIHFSRGEERGYTVKEDKKSLRFSEPTLGSRNDQATTPSIGNISSRRLSVALDGTTTFELPKLGNKGQNESTRVFFESIGLTVMEFPKHFQALIKAKISEFVHDIEYSISMPTNVAGKTTIGVGT